MVDSYIHTHPHTPPICVSQIKQTSHSFEISFLSLHQLWWCKIWRKKILGGIGLKFVIIPSITICPFSPWYYSAVMGWTLHGDYSLQSRIFMGVKTSHHNTQTLINRIQNLIHKYLWKMYIFHNPNWWVINSCKNLVIDVFVDSPH